MLTGIHDWIYPLFVALTAYVVMGITGFGSALLLVPLLARKWPLTEVVLMAILLDIPASILHGGLNLKQVRWLEIISMLPGLLIGTLLGLWLLGQFEKNWLLLLLGGYVVFVGLRSLLPKSHEIRLHKRWVLLAAGIAGLIEVIFATAGPIVVTWLQLRLDKVTELRATVPVVMVVAGTIALFVISQSAQIDTSILLHRWIILFPTAILGVLLGNRIASRVKPLLMKKIMAALLTVSGLTLIKSSFF